MIARSSISLTALAGLLCMMLLSACSHHQTIRTHNQDNAHHQAFLTRHTTRLVKDKQGLFIQTDLPQRPNASTLLRKNESLTIPDRHGQTVYTFKGWNDQGAVFNYKSQYLHPVDGHLKSHVSTGQFTLPWLAIHAKKIIDPQAYAIRHFERTYGPVELAVYQDDLNADGKPDLLIANLALAGQAGMAHLIFIQTDSGLQFSGELFMPRKGYRVLTPAADGQPRLVYASSMGAGQSTIVWVVARGSEFIVEKQEVVHAGDSGTDAGRQRWAEVFGSQ